MVWTHNFVIYDVDGSDGLANLFAVREAALALEVDSEALIHGGDLVADDEPVDARAGLDNDIDVLER